MTNGEQGDREYTTTTEGNVPVVDLAEQIDGVKNQLQDIASQQERIAEAAGGLKSTVEKLLSNRSSERERGVTVVRTAVWVAIVAVVLGFGAFLVTLFLLESMHVSHSAAAAVSNAIRNGGSTCLTLTNIHWPVSALGWAAAVGFLGFAASIAGIVAAIAASISRLLGEGL